MIYSINKALFVYRGSFFLELNRAKAVYQILGIGVKLTNRSLSPTWKFEAE